MSAGVSLEDGDDISRSSSHQPVSHAMQPMSKLLASIRQTCRKAPHLRLDGEIEDLLTFVQDTALIQKLNHVQQRGLCRTMTRKVVERGEYVFHMGDVGDEFYVILSGSAAVQVPADVPCPRKLHKKDDCDCPERPFQTLVYLEKGMGFGELALQSETPRTASVLASDLTELLVVSRANYEQFAGEVHRSFLEQRVAFLRRCGCIEEALMQGTVTPGDIAAMANCCMR